jgi:hypothetical protein
MQAAPARFAAGQVARATICAFMGPAIRSTRLRRDYRVPERFKGYVASLMPVVTAATNLQLAYDELSRR